MRHRRKGRVLGRSPSHRAAMYKNLASALFLTERVIEEGDPNPPKVKGRVITTVHKAKEIRPLVEKCITLAGKAIGHIEEAEQFGTQSARNSAPWKEWRKSQKWRDWAGAMAPAVAIRRRLLQMLGDKQAVKVLLDQVAPRFREREGGYTRIVRLATPRLGDAGVRALIEFVGVRDRKVQKSEKPAFSDDAAEPAKA